MYQVDIANTNVTTENKTVVAGRARAYGVVLNTTGVSGDFHLKDGGSSGTVKFKYKTTGTATTTLPIVINFPQPILFTSDLTVAFVTEHVTVCSIFHSGGNNT